MERSCLTFGLYSKGHTIFLSTSILCSPAWRTVRVVCDQVSIRAELAFLQRTFRQDGCSDQQIHRSLSAPQEAKPPREDHLSVEFSSSVGTIYRRISRMPPKQIMKTVSILSGFPRLLEHQACIPPLRARHTGSRAHDHIRLYHPVKSAVAEHIIIIRQSTYQSLCLSVPPSAHLSYLVLSCLIFFYLILPYLILSIYYPIRISSFLFASFLAVITYLMSNSNNRGKARQSGYVRGDPVLPNYRHS
jgi:hypothetical protein